MQGRCILIGPLRESDREGRELNVLAVDVGGSHVKILLHGESKPRRFDSGPQMGPGAMVPEIKKLAGDWKFDVATIGFPGPVRENRIVGEPHNLGPGWVDFNFEAAFGCPVKVMNDAAMQALGSYRGGKMLFLGLGTGLGTTLIVQDIVVPLELGHLPYKKGSFEDYVGERGLKRHGRKKWQAHVKDVTGRLMRALLPEDVVLGGGNVRLLEELPLGCREGDNDNAFLGGFRMWDVDRKG